MSLRREIYPASHLPTLYPASHLPTHFQPFPPHLQTRGHRKNYFRPTCKRGDTAKTISSPLANARTPQKLFPVSRETKRHRTKIFQASSIRKQTKNRFSRPPPIGAALEKVSGTSLFPFLYEKISFCVEHLARRRRHGLRGLTGFPKSRRCSQGAGLRETERISALSPSLIARVMTKASP